MDIQQQEIVSQYGTFFARHGLSTIIKLGGKSGRIGGVVEIIARNAKEIRRFRSPYRPLNLTETFDFLKGCVL